MANSNETGARGEAIAKELLQAKGYEVLAQNWRFKRAEVDIIVRAKDGTLVFIEVKTRSDRRFGEPEAWLDQRKERLLADAAQAFATQIGHEWAMRFDVVSVVLLPQGEHLAQHFEDVFFPEWEG